MYGKQYELFTQQNKNNTRNWEQIIHILKLPNNIKSIINAISGELQDEVNNGLIYNLLIYYFKSFYKRLFNVIPSIEIINQYENKVNLFIKYLTYNNYDELMKQIIIFLYNIYIDLYIDNLNDDNIVYILPNYENKLIYNKINNIKQLKIYRNKLDLLDSTIIFITKFDNLQMNNIYFENIPVQIKFIINQLTLNNQLKKHVIFINDINKNYEIINNKIYINYNSNLEQLKNNIIHIMNEK